MIKQLLAQKKFKIAITISTGVLLLVLSTYFVAFSQLKYQFVNENWGGGLITKPGTYVLEESGETIDVHIEPKTIVKYSVKDSAGNEIITSVERFSTVMQWCLLWDDNKNLWVISSDIGTFVWRKDSNDRYIQFPVVDDVELIKQIPDEIFSCLSTSTQKNWQSIRDK